MQRGQFRAAYGILRGALKRFPHPPAFGEERRVVKLPDRLCSPHGRPTGRLARGALPVRCDTRITSIFRQLRCLCLHDQARRNARTP